MKSQLFCLILAILLGLSACMDSSYIEKHMKDLIILQSRDANRTIYGYDISKSTLKDEYKTLLGRIPAYTLNIGTQLDYQFYLQKCAKTSQDSSPRRGRVVINGRTYPLSSYCSQYERDFDAMRPTGDNIHQSYSAPWPNTQGLKPVGVEISFDRVYGAIQKKPTYNSTYTTSYDLVTKLRVMCGVDGIIENQQIPQGMYYSEASISGSTIYITFSHYSPAGCPQPIQKPNFDGPVAACILFIFLIFASSSCCINCCIICAPICMLTTLCCCICGCCCMCFCHARKGKCCKKENTVLPSVNVNVPADFTIQQPMPQQYLVGVPSAQPQVQMVTPMPLPVPQEKKEERKVQTVNAQQPQFIEMQQVVLPAPQQVPQQMPQQGVQQPVYAYYPQQPVYAFYPSQ